MNIEGQRVVCAKYAPGDAECEKWAKDTVERMEGASEGSLVDQDDIGAVSYSQPEKHITAKRVAVVIDGGCGSSCEEFVLKVRQSFNVKLIGSPTFGSLDYSNLRPFLLPSGKRELWYATSRSNRLPDFPVDAQGVMPDIFIPPGDGKDESPNLIPRIRRWLEGGSLRPGLKT